MVHMPRMGTVHRRHRQCQNAVYVLMLAFQLAAAQLDPSLPAITSQDAGSKIASQPSAPQLAALAAQLTTQVAAAARNSGSAVNTSSSSTDLDIGGSSIGDTDDGKSSDEGINTGSAAVPTPPGTVKRMDMTVDGNKTSGTNTSSMRSIAFGNTSNDIGMTPSKSASTVNGTDSLGNNSKPSNTSSGLKMTDAEEAAAVAREYPRADTGPLQWTGSGPKPSCVCTFDFDDTLRVARKRDANRTDWDSPAYDAAAVFQACKKVPCFIGIASANHKWQKLRDVTRRLYGTDIFSDSFFSSPAFQFGFHNKTISLVHIKDYFQVSGKCVVLYDDSEYNRKYTWPLGARFEHVKNTTGVQLWNFDTAMDALPSCCFATGKKPNKEGWRSANVTASSGPLP